MYIDLVGVGKPKKYNKAEDCEFLTNDEYLKIARKMIRKYASKYSADLAKEMLASEDAVSNLATQLMYADWRWNEKYTNDGKVALDRYRYRNQCGIWAIKVFITRKRKFTESDDNLATAKCPDSLNKQLLNFVDGKPVDLYTTVEDKHFTENKENEERRSLVSEKINSLLCSGVLNQKQKTFLEEKFVHDKTMTEIAKENNITRQAVSLVILKGIDKLREYVKSNEDEACDIQELINCL